MAKNSRTATSRKPVKTAAGFLAFMVEAGSRVILNSFANNRNEKRKFPARNIVITRPDEVVAFLKEYDVPGRACYWTVSEMKGETRRKEDVAAIRSLFIDIDFKGVVEDEPAIKAVIKQCPLKPSVVIHSGNGFHCYWLLDKPLSAEHGPSCEALMRRICGRLAADLSAAEVVRVLRLPDSHNSKDGKRKLVKVVSELSSRKAYTYAAIDDWCENSPDLLTRVPKKRETTKNREPQNAFQQYADDAAGSTSTFDLDEVLDAMEFHGQEKNGIDDTINRVCGAFVRQKKSVEDCIEALLEPVRAVYERDAKPGEGAFNERRCKREIRGKHRYWTRRDEEKASDADGDTDDDEAASDADEAVEAGKPGKTGKEEEDEKDDVEAWDSKTMREKTKLFPPLDFIDMSSWDDEEPPEREWALQDQMPMANPFLLSGEGAGGKSLLTLQQCVCHALGIDFLGIPTKPGSAIYLGAEDDRDELHRRMQSILSAYKATFADIAGKVHLLSYAGQDAVLATAQKNGKVKTTKLYNRLLREAEEKQPVFIALDTAADIAIINEINRSEVRQFVGHLRRLAINSGAAVSTLAHPSLSGISNNSGISGSTGWHNSMRARAYLKTLKPEGEEDADDVQSNLRLLEFKKNNYGPIAKSITLEWHNGVFRVASDGATAFVDAGRNKVCDEMFMELLERFNSQKRYVSDKLSAKNFAPNLFWREDIAKKQKFGKERFEDSMRRLFALNKLRIDSYGPPSKNTTRLIPTPPAPPNYTIGADVNPDTKTTEKKGKK